MSSLKQIEANRRNAGKSTGPLSPEGKRRSRCNALRHGLTAETVIAALEDAADYEAFEGAVISDYDTESTVERELVLRLASVLWRLRRATGIETALFDLVIEDSAIHERKPLRETFVRVADLSAQSQFLGVPDPNSPIGKDPSGNSNKDIADGFLCLAALPTYPLDRLNRYEHVLWRQARQIVFTLKSMRRHKRRSNYFSSPSPFSR
jgi:hypothetical protein